MLTKIDFTTRGETPEGTLWDWQLGYRMRFRVLFVRCSVAKLPCQYQWFLAPYYKYLYLYSNL